MTSRWGERPKLILTPFLLPNLRTLSLAGTDVTDAGLAHLAGLPNLKTLYLGDTQVTDVGVAKLKMALPNVVIVR